MMRRSRLLDAARGRFGEKDSQNANTTSGGGIQGEKPLRCFPLQAKHVENHLLSASPQEFHSTLCSLIRNARKRVSLASLYIGPAATASHSQESELLQALSEVDTSVDVQIVMDSNRGLRKVPIKDASGETTTTSAAKAVADAIHLQPNHQLFLCQVLPGPLNSILPNPLDEVAGVFHLKAYIVDDTLILSGANLSEEYFVDRQDRYIQISNGGNGLVDFYADLIQILCEHYSAPYESGKEVSSTKLQRRPLQPFCQHLEALFTDENPSDSYDLLQHEDTVAVCVPTFHHPQEPNIACKPGTPLTSDTQVVLGLLHEASHASVGEGSSVVKPSTTSIQLSSAYLNPPQDLVDSLNAFEEVNLLTAGQLSHGFRPKPKAGNKGKAWIPTVFDHLQLEAMGKLPEGTLWHWQKEGWTFHAKGLWITEHLSDEEEGYKPELLAAVTGSSNFGRRSFERDMESNLVLVFPPTKEGQSNPFSDAVWGEWTGLLKDSQPMDPNKIVEAAPSLPLYIRTLFPFIKSFF